jgi:beta-carotene 3-hydroxylase
VARHALVAAGAFVAMEPVAYAAHRWVMHGPGWGWHASHHEARTGTFERNDLYPATFAVAAMSAMSVAARRPRLRPLMAAAVGVTAYGAAYSLVHEVYAHRRMRSLHRRWRGPTWLGDRHRAHHRHGAEPYGMLLPLVVSTRVPDGRAADGSPVTGSPVASSPVASSPVTNPG